MSTPATPDDPIPLNTAKPRIEVHRNVVATPTSITPPPDLTLAGCLYREDGRLLPISQRASGFHGDYFRNADPDPLPTKQVTPLPVLEGRSLYLGHYMPHYGHFLVEMLSTFWPLTSANDYDHFVFHPFINSAFVAQYRDRFPPHVLDAFCAFGIPVEKVRLIDSHVLLREATIPERLIEFNRGANTHVREVYRHLARHFGQQGPGARTDGRYYCSRVGNSLRVGSRIVLNEPSLQRGLRRLGFTVVYPELMSFPQQIAMLGSASVLCGITGSAMHNSLFLRPGSLSIEVCDTRSGDRPNPMQRVCDAVAEVASHFVPFRGRILDVERGMSRLDTRAALEDVAQALRAHGLPSSVTPPRRHAAALSPAELSPLATTWLDFRMVCKGYLRLLKSRLTAVARRRSPG